MKYSINAGDVTEIASHFEYKYILIFLINLYKMLFSLLM